MGVLKRSWRGGDICPTPPKFSHQGTVRESAAALCGAMGTDEQPLGTEYTSSSPSSTTAAGKLDAGSLGSVFGANFGLGATLPQMEENAPDYLFAENYDAGFRRSWGERLTFHIGSAYLAGEGQPALPPRQPLDCCGLPGRSDRGRVVRPGGGPPLIAGRAAAHPHQQRAQCHGPPRPRFGQLTRLCRCVPEPLPLSPGLPHPFSRCWIRVPAAPIACLTDRGACACQQ